MERLPEIGCLLFIGLHAQDVISSFNNESVLPRDVFQDHNALGQFQLGAVFSGFDVIRQVREFESFFSFASDDERRLSLVLKPFFPLLETNTESAPSSR